MEGQTQQTLTEEQITQGTTTEGTAAAETKTDPVASKFGALAKREKSLVKFKQDLANERAEFARMREQFEQERKAFLAERDGHLNIYNEAKKDPRKMLSELGWTYDKLTEAQLTDFKPKPEEEVQAVRQEIEAMRAEQKALREQERQQALEQERQSFEAQNKQAREFVASEIKSLPEKYELINALGQYDMVYDAMLETHKATGKLMTVEEAADIVESYIEEEELKKVLNLKKIQSKFAPQTETPADKTKSTTLTNSNTTSGSSVGGARTEQERMQRALAALSKSR